MLSVLLQLYPVIPQLNNCVHRYWRDQNLLAQFVYQSDIDLLSGDYRKAINGKTNPIATTPNVQFTDYGVQKGKWLNTELKNIQCNQ